MTAVDIAHVLQSAITEEITFVLLAGWRSEEVAEALSSYGFLYRSDGLLDWCETRPNIFDLLVWVRVIHWKDICIRVSMC